MYLFRFKKSNNLVLNYFTTKSKCYLKQRVLNVRKFLGIHYMELYVLLLGDQITIYIYRISL
jgi:hypothetical protein